MSPYVVAVGLSSLLVAGCTNDDCNQATVLSDASAGAYTATGALVASFGAGSQGSLVDLTPSAADAGKEIQITANVGSAGAVILGLTPVSNDWNGALASSSQLCFDAATEGCARLTGEIHATSYSGSCDGSGDDAGPCALSIVATLTATATFKDGSTFSITATLNHEEQLQAVACSPVEDA